ncbi:MAG: lysophospholipid acyltransferase family protein [Bacteroidota bacterium]|nr:lysophospholipid acyltransferase family protein [Bacteroidota bacterium]
MSLLFVLFIRLFSYLPFFILNFFAWKLNFFNRIFFRYRKNIVQTNLAIAFPNKSKKEIKEISKAFFRHLFDIIMEVIKMISAPKSFINNKVTLQNKELIDRYAENKQTILLVFGHFNNWEWVGQKLSHSAQQKVVGIYKPLKNNTFDKLLKTARTRFGAIAISMEESMRYIINTKDECQILGIIADQNPVINTSTYWVPFFGKEVPVFLGIEKIAKKMDYPVIFCDMQKKDIGKYTVKFEVLEENPKETAKGEITKRYFERLQEQIKKAPSNYLWSHRRWKHKR